MITPHFSAERPVAYEDQLGASTYIEKGWGQISLGEYALAEGTLERALALAPNSAEAESLLGWAQMLQDKHDDALLNFRKVLIRDPQNALARVNVGYICLRKKIFGEAIEHLSRAIRLDNDRKATLYAHFYLGLVYLERDMFEDAQTFLQKALALGPNLIEAHYELGRAYWFHGQRDAAMATWTAGHAGGRASGRRVLFSLLVAVATNAWVGSTAQAYPGYPAQAAPERLDRGRFTVVFFPSERTLAAALVDRSIRTDSFPGLPRPQQRVLIAIAPDRRRFREWIGPRAPEWGAAIAFPESHRIVMQGRSANSGAGDPVEVVRHELAHLALHEYLGDLAPQWFDEGYASYAAREWNRDDVLATNFALAIRGMPSLDELDDLFSGGSSTAQTAYALSYRAVAELASLDTEHGLSLFLSDWRAKGSLDPAIRAAFGITLAEFERLWQQRTRRRYGALALASNITLAGLLVLVLLFPLYVLRRQRDRQRMRQLLAADEAADRIARASGLDELLRGDEKPEIGDGASEPPLT